MSHGAIPFLGGDRAAHRYTVVHRTGLCTAAEPPERLEGLPLAADRVPCGTVVSCPECCCPGILPDDGSLEAFLPAGATLDERARTVTWVHEL